MNERLAALDFITACLGIQRTQERTTALRRTIASQNLGWKTVIGLANAHLVSPTLWVALSDRGLANSLPSDVRDYLHEMHRLNSVRNQRLRLQTIEASRALNSIGVTPVLLKGAASLFVKTYGDLGSRVMTDLDLLVPQERAMDCWNQLRTLGYRRSDPDTDVDFYHYHHLEPLSRSGEYATIEVHKAALSPVRTGRLYGVCVTPEDVDRMTQLIRKEAEPVREQEVAMSVPSRTHRTLHLILHSAYVDNAHRCGTLPLRPIHELALMQSVFGEDIDWSTIRGVLEADGKSNVLNDWIYLAHRLYGSPLPDGIEPGFGPVVHFARCRIQARWGLSVSLRTFARLPLASMAERSTQ